ncbi:MAG: DUF4468 domain-containing protein [Bacteroidota bacterium]
MKSSQLNYFFLLFFLLFNQVALTQSQVPNCDLPNVNNAYEFTKTTNFEGISTKKLYHATNIALIEYFKIVEAPIKYQNEELGVIIATAPVNTSFKMALSEPLHYFDFLLRFDFREGRYRLKVNYIKHESINGDSFCSCENDIIEKKCGTFICTTNKEWANVRCQAHEELLKVLAGLELKIQENVKSIVVEEDW